jgi:hypothetical protein
LAGAIVVDDPEGWEETSEVRHRQHGTAMASAILHGDLAAAEPPLGEPLYVRPIIRVDPRHNWVPYADETMPVGRLQVHVTATGTPSSNATRGEPRAIRGASRGSVVAHSASSSSGADACPTARMLITA